MRACLPAGLPPCAERALPRRPPRGTTLGEPERAQFQLRAHIFQARNLPGKDSTGLSDPYAIVRLCGACRLGGSVRVPDG